MENRSELDRINENYFLDSMPANPWEFDVQADSVSFGRLKEVLQVFAHHSVGSWPEDNEWRIALPEWLRREILDISKEEMDRLLAETPSEKWDSLPWDFLSWIDAIRDRGWLWWGYRECGKTATIVLHIASFPERIDAFRELLRASGIRIVNERYSLLP